jgi:hypothetical protein
MRVTGLISLAALVVMGIIGADLIANPTGTTAAGNAVVSIEKPTFNALLGKSTS